MTVIKVHINEVRTRANDYQISGNMLNGGKRVDGIWTPTIHWAEYTRQISSVDFERGLLNCICGRQFIIDDKLTLLECHY
jgi:hypothetical protein